MPLWCNGLARETVNFFVEIRILLGAHIEEWWKWKTHLLVEMAGIDRNK
ncbi:MAG TPA: hypothetical protein VFV86_00150 [Nitrososphaeraceae archaeon]|nr:hypothetical protein [Nitrososphaeraceae archaeon]